MVTAMKTQHTTIGYVYHRKTNTASEVWKLPDNFEPHKAGWLRRPELDKDGSKAWELPDGQLCRHRLTKNGKCIYSVPMRDPERLRKFQNNNPNGG